MRWLPRDKGLVGMFIVHVPTARKKLRPQRRDGSGYATPSLGPPILPPVAIAPTGRFELTPLIGLKPGNDFPPKPPF